MDKLRSFSNELASIYKLAQLDSYQELANSFMGTHGPQGVANLMNSNPQLKGKLARPASKVLQVPSIGKGTGGIMHSGANPMRAASSGTINTVAKGLMRKLATVPSDYYSTKLAAIRRFPKLAWAVPAAEVAGLGVLAKPSVDVLRSRNSSVKEKRHAKYEVGGLGVLAAHPAYEIGKHFLARH